MIAVFSASVAKCRSMQFTETFNFPLANHFALPVLKSKEVTLSHLTSQSKKLFACSDQKLEGLSIEDLYISLYVFLSMRQRSA